MIDKFIENYSFLSNFYNYPVTYEGLTFQNSESAFQAQKTDDLNIKKQFTNISPNKAKKLGRQVNLIKEWELIKDKVMYEVCKAKFSDSQLMKKLLATGEETLIEGNTWHDNYWGDCTCQKCEHIKGKNHLGKILMTLRKEFKTSNKEGEYFDD